MPSASILSTATASPDWWVQGGAAMDGMLFICILEMYNTGTESHNGAQQHLLGGQWLGKDVKEISWGTSTSHHIYTCALAMRSFSFAVVALFGCCGLLWQEVGS